MTTTPAPEYLRALWPEIEPGYLAIWRRQDKQTKWMRTQDLDDFGDVVARNNRDLYIGMGLHPQPTDGRGTADDVNAIPALWADFDIGPGKAPNQQAILELLDSLPFQPSMLVDSGSGGIHAYWLFREAWMLEDADERRAAKFLLVGWEEYIRSRARQLNWTIDKVSDLARILRIPGTYNCKTDTPRPVKILRLTEQRYNPVDFIEYVPEYVPEDVAEVDAEQNGHGPRRFQRWRPGFPCPVCDGHAHLSQGIGRRCWGYLDATGHYARCTREEHRGKLELNRDGSTFSHLIVNAVCRCGVDHRVPASGQIPQPTGTTPPHPEPATGLESRIYRGRQIFDIPVLEPLIEGVIDLDTSVELFGPTNEGKTFVALDWALSVATGTPWAGHPVTQGKVVYVIAEGVRGIAPRVYSWLKHHGLEDVDPQVIFVSGAVNLMDDAQAGELINFTTFERPMLVITDTLARSIVGGDENSSRDMGIAVERMEQVRNSCGACTVFVHHSGRAGAEAGRGSSAIDAAVDTVIRVQADEDDPTIHRLSVRKQRNREKGQGWRMTRIVVEGTISAVLVLDGADADQVRLTEAQRDFLRALRRCQESTDQVSWSLWLDASGKAKSTFVDHVKRLTQWGLVTNTPAGGYRMTESAQAMIAWVTQ